MEYNKLIARLEALEADNAQLKKKLKTRKSSNGSRLPGMYADDGSIAARFYNKGNGNTGYTIDVANTLKLYEWDAVDIVTGHWRKGSIQHRVRSALLASADVQHGGSVSAEAWLAANRQTSFDI